MSNQPAPTRPWFRLASISRPAQIPEPAPAPPRPATVRPAFRPAVQAQPPQTQAQPSAAAPPPPAGGVSSVPISPVGRASQPSSPADKKPTVPVSAATSSVPSSPVKMVPTAAEPTTSPPKTGTTTPLPSSPAKPVVTTTTATTSPAKKAPTTTSVTSSPAQKPASPVTTTTRMPSPKASTTIVKPAIQNQIQSPKTKPPTARPPFPLTLPPSQLKAQAEIERKIPAEAEKKTVLVQKTIDKPEGWLIGAPQKDLGDTRKPSIPLNEHKEPSKEGETKEKGRDNKYSSDSEDSGMRIITITGDNKGAFMEIIQSPHKNGFKGSHYRLQEKANSSRTGCGGSDYQNYSSGNAADRKMKAKSNLSKTMPTNAFINSNVQGINNSIVYNSSCTQHDPGVHLTLHRKPTDGGCNR